MHTLEQIKQQLDERAALERDVLQDAQAKAQLFGYELTKIGEKTEAPKQKRKRRTRAEIEAAAT